VQVAISALRYSFERLPMPDGPPNQLDEANSRVVVEVACYPPNADDAIEVQESGKSREEGKDAEQ
jgi:hypothetical protein